MPNIVETMSPGWYPDPDGRHEHRYWDGSRWTEQIADQGAAGSDPLHPVPPPPVATPAPGRPRRSPALTVLLVVVGVALTALAAFVLLSGDKKGDGGREPGGGPLAGSYEVTGTNADGSSYVGTAEITGSGPDYRIEWSTGTDGSSTSTGRGTLEGNRFDVSFRGAVTGTGTAVYRLRDDGRLVGTWTVEGSTAPGRETLTPA